MRGFAWSGRVVTLASAMLVWLAIQGAAIGADAAGSIWNGDFDAAEALARKTNRPLLVHFYAGWCGPCKKMDRESLYTPEVTRAIDATFVATKVNVEKAPHLQRRFGITSLPTDVIVAPSGKVLINHAGYLTKPEYIGFMKSGEQKFAALPKKTPATVVAQESTPGTKPTAKTAQAPTTGEVKIADAGAATKPDAETLGRETEEAPVDDVRVAMDGFCPVTLAKSRGWVAGKVEFLFEHQNQIYYFAGENELADFKADPAKFAPRLLGCDPVTYSESNIPVPGTTKYGAFFDGELYLFETAENRAKFKSDPTKFSSIRQVLKVEDVKRRRA
jgi:YHS domain-containing protein/thiol-disulfide isomerase/thioredoxin